MGDLEKLLFSEHGVLVRQHLAVGSKQQTLNQSFTACPNRLKETHTHTDTTKVLEESSNKQRIPAVKKTKLPPPIHERYLK